MLVAVAGVVLLVLQVPSNPPRTTLRLTDRQDRLLGSLDPEVLERALVESMEQVPGVTHGAVRLIGSAGAPRVQAQVTVDESAETGWVASQARRGLAEDVSTVLGTAPVRVDLLVRLRTGRAPKTATVPRGAEGTAAPAAGVDARVDHGSG